MSRQITLNDEENQAILRLLELTNEWPRSLSLFGHSGSLVVVKCHEDGLDCAVEEIQGIDCDGGDPQESELDYRAEVIHV